jgi:UDP-N-acetylglucosamine:LPS N-acetylglucosamine transferase
MRSHFVEQRRTALVASAGGHWAELDRAVAGIVFTHAVRVTYRHAHRRADALPVRYLLHPRRSLLRTLINALQALLLVVWERPRVVISTGADVAVPFLWWAKLFGARIVFIETGGSLAPSLSGRLVYPIADLFVVQWPQQLARYPRAILARTLLL